MKKVFGTAFATTAVGLAASLLAWSSVPDPMPIHWGADGAANGFAPKVVGLLMLPVITLLVSLFVGGIMHIKEGARKVAVPFTAIMGGFMLGTHVLVIMAARTEGFALSLGMLYALMGLLMVGLGYYMPRLRQNPVAGVRTPWTLSDEVNWKLTHRFAGWSMGIAGAVAIVASAALSGTALSAVAIGAVLLGSFLPLGYSYLIHRLRR